jgi:hypothetical protein
VENRNFGFLNSIGSSMKSQCTDKTRKHPVYRSMSQAVPIFYTVHIKKKIKLKWVYISIYFCSLPVSNRPKLNWKVCILKQEYTTGLHFWLGRISALVCVRFLSLSSNKQKCNSYIASGCKSGFSIHTLMTFFVSSLAFRRAPQRADCRKAREMLF